MEDMETFWKKLNKQLVEAAAAIDPAFREKVEADRREIEEHEKRLEAQRTVAQQREEPKTEWHNLWEKMAK